MARQATFNEPMQHDLVVLERFARLVAAQEREACAIIVDECYAGNHPAVAEKIRARNDE